jgi:hypothetical protein
LQGQTCSEFRLSVRPGWKCGILSAKQVVSATAFVLSSVQRVLSPFQFPSIRPRTVLVRLEVRASPIVRASTSTSSKLMNLNEKRV